MNNKLPFEIGLAKLGGEKGVPYNRDYERTDGDQEAAKKSDASPAWKETSRLNLPPVVLGLGDMALEGQGLPGMGKEVATIPINDESGPAQIVEVQFS